MNLFFFVQHHVIAEEASNTQKEKVWVSTTEEIDALNNYTFKKITTIEECDQFENNLASKDYLQSEEYKLMIQKFKHTFQGKEHKYLITKFFTMHFSLDFFGMTNYKGKGSQGKTAFNKYTNIIACLRNTIQSMTDVVVTDKLIQENHRVRFQQYKDKFRSEKKLSAVNTLSSVLNGHDIDEVEDEWS